MRNYIFLGMGVFVLAGIIIFTLLNLRKTSNPGLTIPPAVSITPGITAQPTRIVQESSGCKIGGCSMQVCSDKEVVTTCEYRAEYACYPMAICERRKDGKCGWRQTEELKNCIEDALSKKLDTPVL